MLDVCTVALRRRGIQSCRLDGTLNFTQRDTVLRTFRTEPAVPVLLASIRTGGVGLNLVTANVVILIDPWWHVHAENQAIDRGERGTAQAR